MRISKTLTFMLIWGLVFPVSVFPTKKDDKEETSLEDLQKQINEWQSYQNKMDVQRKMNSLNVETGSAKFGLRCKVPEAFPQEIIGLCPSPPQPWHAKQLQSEGKIPLVREVYYKSQKYMADYEVSSKVEMENIDTERQSYQHLGCLNEELDRLKRDVFDARVKRINDMISKVTDDHEKMMRKNQKDEQFIKDKFNEMYLGRGIDYKKKFDSPACQNIYSPEDFQNMASGGASGSSGKGYEGILNSTLDNRKNSDNFRRDSASIRQDIKNSITRAANRAGNEGLFGFKNEFDGKLDIGSKIAGTATFKAGISDMQSKVKEYFGKVDRQIKNVLDHKGIDKGIYDALVGNANGEGGSEDLDAAFVDWQNRREQKCFYDTFNGGASKIEKIVDSFNQFDRRMTNTIRSQEAIDMSNYIKQILNNTGMGIAAKANLIKRYVASNPRLKALKVQLGTGFRGKDGNHLWSADELMNSIKNECFARMGNKAFGPKPGTTLKAAIRRVKRLKNSIKRKQDNFKREFANELTARVLTCTQTSTGEAEIKRSCNAKSMLVEGEFCFRHANQCARDTNACLGNLQRRFDRDRETLRKRVQDHNDSHRQQAQRQYNLFKSLRNITRIEGEALQGQFSQALYEDPKGIDVKLPEEKAAMKDLEGLKEKLGLGIIDPEEFNKQMTGNLEKLKKSVEKQNKEALKQVEEYVDQVKKNMENAKTKWTEINRNCSAILSLLDTQNSKTGPQRIPICENDGSLREKVADDRSQVMGIAKDIKSLGLIDENKTDFKDKDVSSVENIQDIDTLLTELKTELEKNDKRVDNNSGYSKDSEDSSNNYKDKTNEIIKKYCNKLELSSYLNKELNCESIISEGDLTREVQKVIQSEVEIVHEILVGIEKEGTKVCKNQNNDARWDAMNKSQTPPFNNNGGGLLENIFRTLTQ